MQVIRKTSNAKGLVCDRQEQSEAQIIHRLVWGSGVLKGWVSPLSSMGYFSSYFLSMLTFGFFTTM